MREGTINSESLVPIEAVASELALPAHIELEPDCDPEAVELSGVKSISIRFPSFSDGRGFSIARALRRRGFAGRLEAKGALIADQYALARRVGFDEVEIRKGPLAEGSASRPARVELPPPLPSYQSRLGMKRLWNEGEKVAE